MRLLILIAAFLVAPALTQAQTTVLGADASSVEGPAVKPIDQELAKINEPEPLLAEVARAHAAGDIDTLGRVYRRLSQLRPHIGQYKYEMAAAFAAQDFKTLTYNALLELQAQGYGFDLAKDPRFQPVTTTEVWEYIVQAFEANRKPFGEAKLMATLPKDDLLIESVAWDPTRKAALVGSAREGTVYVVGAEGELTPLVKADDKNGMWAVFDLAVDAKRGVLWVASTAVPHYKRYNAEKDLGRAGVFKFDLKTGKFLKSYLSPVVIGQSFVISTLGLAPDGTVFAADGVNDAVYQVRDDRFQRLFHVPVLGSIRGLAVSGDGKILYFADHERGLFGYDLATGKPFEVIGSSKLALGGIEGLQWWRNQLVIVQSAMKPARVMRLKLTPDGKAVAGVQPLSANQPEVSLPTLATLDGDRLLFVGNSQKLSYDRFGLPRNKDRLEGTRLIELDLNFGATPDAMPE
ncbi:hypothetical protein [Pseudomarimonas arenosa]|uniref:SMP-30/Gluconolactonase/LRE-like region domain-containing protein n=1 Tax=Pseudomarimonas arenosa TaxID=2774145 RepID=A0AAW3ZN34_9GAMM|nr:hypothetical protein [Pseudomarimonas arenosa]MBD8526584.1 hypothetical protein [Pseudomarimonas arenosa]